jgi:hypothetical protein
VPRQEEKVLSLVWMVVGHFAPGLGGASFHDGVPEPSSEAITTSLRVRNTCIWLRKMRLATASCQAMYWVTPEELPPQTSYMPLSTANPTETFKDWVASPSKQPDQPVMPAAFDAVGKLPYPCVVALEVCNSRREDAV